MSRLAAIGLSIALAGAAPAPEISQTVPKPAPPQTASPSGVEHILLLLGDAQARMTRSEEHTSELQSLMRISYAVFCLKKKTHPHRSQLSTNITTHHD